MSALVMSSISVVQYQSSPKLNVLQQSQNTNGREIIILRKPQQILPQTNEILLTNPARKKSTDSKMTNPAPVAVARRNARERNRVKQVNNGFATLRQHIPNSIAAAFESTSGRGGNKKLSKVETLRMAVEYIRSLEDILACDGSENTSISSSYNSSTDSSPAVTTIANNMSYSYPILSPSNDDDDLSTNPTPPPYQYNQNYQVISYNFYDDSENLEPLDDNILSDPSLIDADLELGNQDLSLLNTMHTTTGSLSPEIYSDSSLSPISLGRNDRKMYIPVFDSPTEDSKVRINPEILTQIKTEPQYMIEGDAGSPKDSKENMIQVMAWWEQQQSRS